MAKYRNKLVVEAHQWNVREKPPVGIEFCSCDIDEETCKFCVGGFVTTSQGKVKIAFGDWVVTGVKGEKQPLTDEIFQLTYELVE